MKSITMQDEEERGKKFRSFSFGYFDCERVIFFEPCFLSAWQTEAGWLIEARKCERKTLQTFCTQQRFDYYI